MENHPLVSIVVVSYNHAQYIKENLDSIKSQTYPNIELIVADDASTDNSVDVFEKWLIDNNFSAKKNFHKNNTGLGTILNECIKMINGKYVKLIAADDYLHPESIRKCVEKLEEFGEDYGMICTNAFIVDENSNIAKNSLNNYSPEEVSNAENFHYALRLKNRIIAPSVLMRTSSLTDTGPYKKDKLVEDYYRWLIISEYKKISYINEKLSYYRWHGNNITLNKKYQIMEEDIQLKFLFAKDKKYSKSTNDAVRWLYFNSPAVSRNLKKEYKKYPFKNKKLNLFLRFNIPSGFYKFITQSK